MKNVKDTNDAIDKLRSRIDADLPSFETYITIVNEMSETAVVKINDLPLIKNDEDSIRAAAIERKVIKLSSSHFYKAQRVTESDKRFMCIKGKKAERYFPDRLKSDFVLKFDENRPSRLRASNKRAARPKNKRILFYAHIYPLAATLQIVLKKELFLAVRILSHKLYGAGYKTSSVEGIVRALKLITRLKLSKKLLSQYLENEFKKYQYIKISFRDFLLSIKDSVVKNETDRSFKEAVLLLETMCYGKVKK